MKHIITREIFIEIETTRVTKKRSVRRNAAQPPKSDHADRDDSFVRTNARLKHLFDKIYKGEF